jgi:hypothetical protein
MLTVGQAVCGMSVVDGDWTGLKKYNLTELRKIKKLDVEAGSKDETAVKPEVSALAGSSS